MPTAASGARAVLPCADLDETLAYFTTELGFVVDAISPADAPVRAILSGHGLRVELQRGLDADPGILRVATDSPGEPVVAPNGTLIEYVPLATPLVVPELAPELVVVRRADAKPRRGRAGMLYRDLLPGRQGGRFVASAIEIAQGGPVADWVHHHKVRVQLLYCVRGSVRLVYEDQGPPFELVAGDCVLQPPGIRHQVLESADGLEVVEVACPAEHDTLSDHNLVLPTPVRERIWDGQRFVHHVAAETLWHDGDPFDRRETGIAAATDGLADVGVLRGTGSVAGHHDGELLFRYVLAGAVRLRVGEGALAEDSTADADAIALGAGDAVTVPPGAPHRWTASGPAEWLEVAVAPRRTS